MITFRSRRNRVESASRERGRPQSPERPGPCPSPFQAEREEAASGPLLGFEKRLHRFVPALGERLRSGALCDVTLCADGAEFPCHRLALACHSDYFAGMFEGSFSEAQPRSRVQLHGKSSDAVGAMLRVLYFEATLRDVLLEDPRRSLQMFDMANEWLMQDVIDGCIEFVQRDIDDISVLEFLCESVCHVEYTRKFRQQCEERLRNLREIEAARKQAAALGISGQDLAADPNDRRGRWAPDRGHPEHWTTPVQCPRGLGW